MARKQRWKEEPDEHDYPAAADYLGLILDDVRVSTVVESLRASTIVHRKAKDLLRASGLPLLSVKNVHVAEDLAKVKKSQKLSPVLLVRGNASAGLPLIVADGYHRICASYYVDEDADIPCRLASLDPDDGARTAGPR